MELPEPAGLQPLPPASFAEFIAASRRLERSYRDLQREVAELNLSQARSQQALLARETDQGLLLHRMEQILSAVPCGTLLLNTAGEVLQMNPEAARLRALCAAQFPDLTSLLEGDSTESVPSSGSHREAFDEKVLTLVTSDGPHWIAVRRLRLGRLSAETDASAAVWLFTLQDITSRMRAEHDRERAHASAALAQAASLLAHEVRNPLASMELFAELMTQSPERNTEWVAHLQAGVRSLTATVNNVLLMSAGEAAPSQQLDLCAEVSPLIDFLQPLAAQAEIRLRFHAPDVPVRALANSTSLHQILMNLCMNAFRHTPPAGEVRVRCDRSSTGTPQLSVTDTGSGIASDQLARLFEPGATGSGQRTGLGLAVCDRLMRQQGGRIRASSIPGQGSQFTVEFAAA